MVELWNQYKFNFPTGKVNLKQLKQLVRKVNYNLNNERHRAFLGSSSPFISLS